MQRGSCLQSCNVNPTVGGLTSSSHSNNRRILDNLKVHFAVMEHLERRLARQIDDMTWITAQTPEHALFQGALRRGLDEVDTLRTLNTFAVDLISIPSIDDLFWYVAHNVVGRLNFVDCVIYQTDDETSELVQVAAMGDKNPFGRNIINTLRIPFGQGITGRVAQTGKVIVIDDLLTDQTYIPDTTPARSEICVPLVCGDRVMGVIDSEHPLPGAFGEAEREILVTIAAMTSAKLELLTEAERSRQRYHDLVTAHAQLSLETTSRKALETELFNARKLEAIGRLTGRFAHEFNNMLTVISGNLEFLSDMVLTPHDRNIIHDAQDAAYRGTELIKAMLAFSQRTHLVPEKVDLNAFLTATYGRNARAAHSDVQLELCDASRLVNVDLETLDVAIRNLIANARDATRDGGMIRISTRSVTYALTDKIALATPILPGHYMRLSVQDRGTGIPPRDIQKIFDPFFTTKQTGYASGLGLSVVLGFIQQSGGGLAVDSAPGKGTTCHLYLPVATSHVKTSEETPPQA